MASQNGIYTFEEYLTLTNKEIISNISRLRAVICYHEPQMTWDEATMKARELKKTGKVNEYLNAVRAGFRQTEEKKSTIEPPTDSGSGRVPNPTIYQKNYDRLTSVAPGLDLKLRNYDGGDIYGKAVKTGYLDFHLELLRHEGHKFYIRISQYDKTESGKTVPAPDMEIVVDIKKSTVEALKYKDAHKDIEVYQKVQDRKLTDKGEKRSQNRFLGDWLRKLRNHGQKIKWSKTNSARVPESFIVDEYKKDVSQETEFRLVPPVENPEKAEKKPKEDMREHEKIIVPETTNMEKEQLRGNGLDKFLSIVSFLEGGKMGSGDFDLNERVNHILSSQGLLHYLSHAWEELQRESDKRLKKLNFYRLIFFDSGILELLNNSGSKLRLVSEKSTDTFSIELGDDRKKTAKILAVYQLTGKDDVPTLLLKVNEQNNSVSVDLILNGFMNLETFSEGDESSTDLKAYQASIGVENWLKFLKENKYKAIAENLTPVEEAEPEAIEPDQPEDQEEYDNDYINKDIPDFEPGHVELTETHKKHHVTQKMIDRINETQKGITVYPRSQKMVYNTKNKGSDKNKQAMQPGFRMSRTGKLYYEGRSNRADRDLNTGL